MKDFCNLKIITIYFFFYIKLMNTVSKFSVYFGESLFRVKNLDITSIEDVQDLKKYLQQEKAFNDILNLGLDKIHLFRKGNQSPIQELTNGIMIDGSWNGGEFVLKVSSNQGNLKFCSDLKFFFSEFHKRRTNLT